MTQLSQRWWEARWFLPLAALLSALPLLWPDVPPLVDLPGHIGRYQVALAIGYDPDLARHWIFHWALIGNLGVDLLVMPLAPLVGVESAAKLITIAIPPLFVTGLARVSRAEGRSLSPLTVAGFALAYNYSFHLGFVNYTLAAALALHALASWIRLGAAGRTKLRAIAFVPISCALYLAHSFGWALFGLLAVSAELARLRQGEASWKAALSRSALAGLGLSLPLIAVALGQNGGGLGVEYTPSAKLTWAFSLVRDRWQWLDAASAIAVLVGLFAMIRRPSFRFDRPAAAAAFAGVIAFLALPRLLMGAAYVDMRILAPSLAIAFAAIRVSDPRIEQIVARLASAFFAIRIAATTLSLALYSQTQHAALEAVTHIPRGAAVLTLVDEPCGWSATRLAHLGGIAIARRSIFDNEQWAIAGQQLIQPRHREAGMFTSDPSEIVYQPDCPYRPTTFAGAIKGFDRNTFGFVWTIGFPARRQIASDVGLVWSNNIAALYRVAPPSQQ